MVKLKIAFKTYWRLWLATLLTAVVLLLIKPLKTNKEVPKEGSYKAFASGISYDNPGGGFEVVKPNEIALSPGANNPVTVKLIFKDSGEYFLKFGVYPWADTTSPNGGTSFYHFTQNDSNIFIGNIQAHYPINQSITINKNDTLSFTIGNGKAAIDDLGCIFIYKAFPSRPFWVFAAILTLCFTLVYLPIQSLFAVIVLVLVAIFEAIVFGKLNTNSIIYYSFVAVFLTTISSFLRQVKVKFLSLIFWTFYALLTLYLVALPLLAIGYFKLFKGQLSSDEYRAIFQSNLSESIEFITNALGANWLVPILLITLSYSILLILSVKVRSTKRLSFLNSSLLIISSTIALFLSPPLEVNEEFLKSRAEYLTELKAFREARAEFIQNKSEIQISRASEGETYIVIIGESLNKNHMSLFGYGRNTTPRLDDLAKNEKLIVLQNAVSSHTHTTPVLMKALTSANQVNGELPTKSISIVQAAEAAGFRTYWLSNQVKYGIWDNPISVIADECDYQRYINKNIGMTSDSEEFDGRLVDELKKVLNENDSKESKMIFIHLLGNHGIYKERYPELFQVFDTTGAKSFFGSQSQYQTDDYDNSVLYNDYVVSQIIKTSQAYLDNENAALFYFSDHGEDVFGNRGHNISSFTYDMTQIPSAFWFSKQYLEKFPRNIEFLKSNSTQYFSNDFAFNTVLNMANLKSEFDDETINIFTSEYRLSPLQLSINSGEYPIASAENKSFVIQENVFKLKTLGLFDRILIHRVNTKGMYYDVLSKGMTRVECDFVFNQSKLDFEIGHDEHNVSGNLLSDLLCWKTRDSLEFLWLDIKNFDKSNSEKIEKYLLNLNYPKFKNKTLIETMYPNASVKRLVQNGFQVSYYLPGIDLLEKGSESDKRAFAQKLSNNISEFGFNNISFSAECYPWVKTYLEPLISKEIKYHTWILDLEIDDAQLIEKLSKNTITSDTRIKSIIIKYINPFYLWA